jgi:hypothetical protein
LTGTADLPIERHFSEFSSTARQLEEDKFIIVVLFEAIDEKISVGIVAAMAQGVLRVRLVLLRLSTSVTPNEDRARCNSFSATRLRPSAVSPYNSVAHWRM